MALSRPCCLPGGFTTEAQIKLDSTTTCQTPSRSHGCNPTRTPIPCETAASSYDFGLNLNLRSRTGCDYSASTGCQLVRSSNLQEWGALNDFNASAARIDKETSECIRETSKRQMGECLSSAHRCADDTTKKLFARVQSTDCRKTDLERTIEDMRTEIQHLTTSKNRLRSSLNTTQIAYMIATDCLGARRRRIDGDLVTDQVDNGLMNEVDIVKRARDLLENTTVTAERMLVADRRVKDALEHDYSDKKEATRIDGPAGELTLNSSNVQPYPGVRALHSGLSTTDAWHEFTDNNLQRADRQLCESRRLKQLIDQVLEESARNILEAHEMTGSALQRRIKEMVHAIQLLEHELCAVVQEIASQERNIASLKAAIGELERRLAVAETRAQRRSFRPNVEECRDLAQCNVADELQQLAGQLQLLRQRLSEAQTQLQQLLSRRSVLQNQLAVKRESLRIDKDKVYVVRGRYPAASKLLGY